MTARRTCTKCGVAYPATSKHYARTGEQLRTMCKHCDRARRLANKVVRQMPVAPWRGAQDAARDLAAFWP